MQHSQHPGPYAWTRNPLYLGSFLLGLGFAIMSAKLDCRALLIVLPSFVIYPNVIRKEEAHLQRLFPDEFREYCAKVPRFFPTLSIRSGVLLLKQYLANREYKPRLVLALCWRSSSLKWRLI